MMMTMVRSEIHLSAESVLPIDREVEAIVFPCLPSQFDSYLFAGSWRLTRALKTRNWTPARAIIILIKQPLNLSLKIWALEPIWAIPITPPPGWGESLISPGLQPALAFAHLTAYIPGGPSPDLYKEWECSVHNIKI